MGRDEHWAQRAGHPLRTALRAAGLDVVRFPRGPIAEHLNGLAIDTVIDVGANEGQYASQLREYGFTGRIHSFEPGAAAFSALQRAASGDPRWTCHPQACGREHTTMELGVSAYSVFSSLRAVRPDTVALTSEAGVVRRERVDVRRLDELWQELALDGQRVWVKSDTQGSDRDVLLGLGARLTSVIGVQIEMSVVPLYEGQPSWTEMMAWLETEGFALSSVVPGFRDPARWRLMELDGLFVNQQQLAR